MNFFRMLIGKSEAVVSGGQGHPQRPNQNRNRKSGGGSGNLVAFVVRIVASFGKNSFVELFRILTNSRQSTVCPHRADEASCLVYVVKVNIQLETIGNLNSAWMGDCLGTPAAAGMGLDTDAAYSPVYSVNLQRVQGWRKKLQILQRRVVQLWLTHLDDLSSTLAEHWLSLLLLLRHRRIILKMLRLSSQVLDHVLSDFMDQQLHMSNCLVSKVAFLSH